MNKDINKLLGSFHTAERIEETLIKDLSFDELVEIAKGYGYTDIESLREGAIKNLWQSVKDFFGRAKGGTSVNIGGGGENGDIKILLYPSESRTICDLFENDLKTFKNREGEAAARVSKDVKPTDDDASTNNEKDSTPPINTEAKETNEDKLIKTFKKYSKKLGEKFEKMFPSKHFSNALYDFISKNDVKNLISFFDEAYKIMNLEASNKESIMKILKKKIEERKVISTQVTNAVNDMGYNFSQNWTSLITKSMSYIIDLLSSNDNDKNSLLNKIKFYDNSYYSQLKDGNNLAITVKNFFDYLLNKQLLLVFLNDYFKNKDETDIKNLLMSVMNEEKKKNDASE